MLRSAIWLLLAFAGAVVLALVLRSNHGNIAILWPPYRIELSSNMALILTIVAFFVLHVVLLAIGRTLSIPQRIRAYRVRRREQRSHRALQGAVLALFEGRYDRAERLAATALANGDERAGRSAAALVAARSAHRLGAPQRRDDWVRRATDNGETQAATLMVQAEFAVDDNQPARALDAVDRMTAAGGAQQPVALEAALTAYRQAGRWDRVLDTTRQLSRRGRLSEQQAAELRLAAYMRILAAREGDARAIRELWKSLRADERKLPQLAAPTVVALAQAGSPEDARKIALAVLDAGYDEATVEAYGAMAALAPRQRLEQLERWRVRHGDKPKLLEMLGRVCASERLWGKAEAYLLGSLAAGDSVSARVGLAQLYEAIDRPRDAATQYQLAARLALGERQRLPGAAAPSAQALAAASSGAQPAAGPQAAAVEEDRIPPPPESIAGPSGAIAGPASGSPAVPAAGSLPRATRSASAAGPAGAAAGTAAATEAPVPVLPGAGEGTPTLPARADGAPSPDPDPGEAEDFGLVTRKD